MAKPKEIIKAEEQGSSGKFKNNLEEPIDNFAEVPEEVLDEKDLKELAEMKKAPVEEKKKPWERDKKPVEAWEPKTELGREVKSGKRHRQNEN